MKRALGSPRTGVRRVAQGLMSSPQIHMWIRGRIHLQACVWDERESDASAGRRHREEKRDDEQTSPSFLSSPPSPLSYAREK